jgi:uncharacterized protein YndB with AHSA1/START domain
MQLVQTGIFVALAVSEALRMPENLCLHGAACCANFNCKPRITNMSKKKNNPSQASANDAKVLVVTRVFSAPAERVFDAWLDPASVGRWLFATPKGKMQRVEIDPRVGGKFVIVEKRGRTLADHVGTYEVMDRPRRLVFSYSYQGEKPTRVTVEIESVAGGCKLTLSHEIDPKWSAYLEQARAGWTMILEGLAECISRVTHQRGAGGGN